MTDWIATHAEGIKALAGPFATVIAALAATIVAIIFGIAQVHIAKSQRDIARSQKNLVIDRLKVDLFDRRYAVYCAVEDALDIVEDTKSFDTEKIKAIEEKMKLMKLSAFIFTAEVCHYTMSVYEKLIDIVQLMSLRNIEEQVEKIDQNKLDELDVRLQASRVDLKRIGKESAGVFITSLHFSELSRDERRSRGFFHKAGADAAPVRK